MTFRIFTGNVFIKFKDRTASILSSVNWQ